MEVWLVTKTSYLNSNKVEKSWEKLLRIKEIAHDKYSLIRTHPPSWSVDENNNLRFHRAYLRTTNVSAIHITCIIYINYKCIVFNINSEKTILVEIKSLSRLFFVPSCFLHASNCKKKYRSTLDRTAPIQLNMHPLHSSASIEKPLMGS